MRALKVTIDRFEGDFAVVEISADNFVNMPRALVPDKAVEGSVISITLDCGKAQKRTKKTEGLMNKLFHDQH